MSDDLQTIRLSITVKADPRVSPDTILRNVESSLSLMAVIVGSPVTEGDIEDGRISGYNVTFDTTPRDTDRPFSLFEQEGGGDYNDTPSKDGIDTWTQAIGAAQDLEDSGVFVQIKDGTGKIVYSTEE